MEQVGFVRRILDDKVELEVRRISGCGGGCSSCSSHCDSPPHIITLPNKLNAKVGDFVELKGETKRILKYALIVYIIPIVFLILGIALGTNYFEEIGNTNYEILGFLIGIIFLVISYLLVKLIDRRIAKRGENAIQMMRIL